jgi:hypothetical protein
LHSKQYFALPFRKVLQVLILHRRRVTGLLASGALQPGQGFLSLKCAAQMPQLMPHGAISEYVFRLAIGDALFIIRDSRTNLPAESRRAGLCQAGVRGCRLSGSLNTGTCVTFAHRHQFLARILSSVAFASAVPGYE